MQDMEKKLQKQEKRLKKKNDDRVRDLNQIKDKNKEKRQKALDNFKLKVSDKEHEANKAFG